MNSKFVGKNSTTLNFNKVNNENKEKVIPNVAVEEEPTSKRPRVDLNDSFYDEEQDDLISEACGISPQSAKKNIIVPFFNNPQERPESSSFTHPRTPCTPLSTNRSPPHRLNLSKNTTLKGKPLESTPVSTREDENLISTSRPFIRLAMAVKELTTERDQLLIKVLDLEKRLSAKEKENDEISIKNADLLNQVTAVKKEMEEIVKNFK